MFRSIALSFFLLVALAACQRTESDAESDTLETGFRRSFPDRALFAGGPGGQDWQPQHHRRPPEGGPGSHRPGGPCRPGSAGCDYDQFVYFSNVIHSYVPEYSAFVWVRAFLNPEGSVEPMPVPLAEDGTPFQVQPVTPTFAASMLEIDFRHPFKQVPVRGFTGDGAVKFYNLPAGTDGVSPGILMRVDSAGASAALIALRNPESGGCTSGQPQQWLNSWWWQPPRCSEPSAAPPVEIEVRAPRAGGMSLILSAEFETGVVKHFDSGPAPESPVGNVVRVFGKTIQYRGEGLYQPFR